MSFTVLRFLEWGTIEGTFFSEKKDALEFFHAGSYRTTQMLVSSLGEELKYWGLRGGRDEDMRKWWRENYATQLDLELQVANLAGASWTLRAHRLWSVRDAKGKIEQASEVPAREQRLLFNTSALQDSQVLGELCGNATTLVLTLVRRHPQQAEWMEKVKAEPSKLAEAPADMRADAEVVMAAASQDERLQFLAAPQLLAEAPYVFEAIKRKGGPKRTELLAAPLKWVQTSADVKLALRAALHLESPDMAADVFRLKALASASEEERVLLAVEPSVTPEVAKRLLEGLSKDVVQRALQRSTLVNLPLGLRLLELESAASHGGVVGRALASLMGGGKCKYPILEGEIMKSSDYAMALFLRHADALNSQDSAAHFLALLPHIDGLTPPGIEACSLLVRACLLHQKPHHAQTFFQAGADDSEQCAALLTETGLDLPVLAGHPLRAALFARVLQRYGGPAEVLAAVAEDRDSLRTLLGRAHGDADVCCSPALQAALELAALRNDEEPGRVLLRAFASVPPQRLPDFQIPLPWLQELRGVSGCDSLIIEKLLETLEAAGDEEFGELLLESWSFVHWEACTQPQLERACALVKRLGLSREGLASAGGAGTELEARLTNALAELPLARLASPMLLCAPGLPPQAVSLFAVHKARAAEEQALEAKEAARRASERAARVEAATAQLRADLEDSLSRERDLRREVSQLKRKLEQLDRPRIGG